MRVHLGRGVFGLCHKLRAQVNNIQNNGTKVAAIDVTRPTSATQTNPVPHPDFMAYRTDPSTVHPTPFS